MTMNPEIVFLVCNNGVLPAWLLLAVLPHHRVTQLVVHAVWIPALLALFYGWALFAGPPPAEGAGFGSLAALMLLFQSPMALLGGWIHYLAFDLFVGAWIVRDAREQGINHWLTVPCLLATLMAGPLGLLLYALLRFGLKRRVSLYPVAAAA
jgi:hypothetical protein